MDRLGVDVQVMYPTLFLTTVSAKPDVEYALVRAYNRWLGAKSDESGGRLRWVVIPPILSMEKAAEELEWGKEHGACGAFKRGVEAGSRSASDPYFFPLYEAAERLDMPVCVHIAAGDPAITDTLSSHLTMYQLQSLADRRVHLHGLGGHTGAVPEAARGLHRDDVVLDAVRDGRAAGAARALRLDGPVRAGAGPLPPGALLHRLPDPRRPAPTSSSTPARTTSSSAPTTRTRTSPPRSRRTPSCAGARTSRRTLSRRSCATTQRGSTALTDASGHRAPHGAPTRDAPTPRPHRAACRSPLDLRFRGNDGAQNDAKGS